MRKYKITLPKDYNIRAICNLLKPYPHVSIWGGFGEYWLELDNEKDYNELKVLIYKWDYSYLTEILIKV